MNGNLPIQKQNSKVALSKTKSLMSIADKILVNSNGVISIDDSWIERLWDWADEYDVPDLEGLPRDKDKLLNLTGFYYIGSLQADLPKEICNLTNLTSICMQACDITGFPNEIVNLINLTEFCFHANLLTEVPREIGKLINLTELYLEENQLENIPDEISNLTNLTYLGLDYNELKQLPEKIVFLTNLKHLGLSENSNLILSSEQKEWMLTLEKNGCSIVMDHDLFDRNLKI